MNIFRGEMGIKWKCKKMTRYWCMKETLMKRDIGHFMGNGVGWSKRLFENGSYHIRRGLKKEV